MPAKKKTPPKTEQQNSSEESQQNDTMVSLGGLWLNKSKNGELYFSGYLGNAKLYIFKNKKKEKENQPDYYMMLANKQTSQSATADEFEQQAEKDDIPF